MGVCIDMIGKKIGMLTFLSNTKNGLALCRCDCGIEKYVRTDRVRDGSVKSCGCLMASMKHGHTNSKEYEAWQSMNARCYNPKNRCYARYGARGITVCPEWRHSFPSFYKDLGAAPSVEHSLDRKDNNKGYSPENCRWATDLEQSNNTSRNRHISFAGITKTIAQWSRITGVDYGRIQYHCFRKGLPLDSVVRKFSTSQTSLIT